MKTNIYHYPRLHYLSVEICISYNIYLTTNLGYPSRRCLYKSPACSQTTIYKLYLISKNALFRARFIAFGVLICHLASQRSCRSVTGIRRLSTSGFSRSPLLKSILLVYYCISSPSSPMTLRYRQNNTPWFSF